MSSSPKDRPSPSADNVQALAVDPEVVRILRLLMYRLAREQDSAAADQAALVPYWQPCPLSVEGIRAAAHALRAAADALPSFLAGVGIARLIIADGGTAPDAIGSMPSVHPAA